jgi:hypothetical protein
MRASALRKSVGAVYVRVGWAVLHFVPEWIWVAIVARLSIRSVTLSPHKPYTARGHDENIVSWH